MVKVCPRCHESKDETEFSRNRRAKDGLQYTCKPCHRAAVRSAPSQSLEGQRARFSRRTPEQIRRATERVKQWKARNPFEARLSAMERRARSKWKQAGLPADVFKYADVLARDGWNCYLCGGSVMECELSFDHVVPLSARGPHSMENVKVTHIRCNDSKGAKVASAARWQGRGKSTRGCYRPTCLLHREES